MSAHLNTAIDQLKKKLLALGALVEDMVFRAVKSLRDRDTALAAAVIASDEQADACDVDIEEECQKILALHQPVAHDLRFIITVLKINTELERIGDAAVNIAERAGFLAEEDPIDIPFDFPGMSDKARRMLKRALDAFVEQDVHIAHEVIALDDEVDAINRHMYQQVEDGIRRTPERVDSLIHLLGVSRHIERIGDHASNIAEDVIYLIEGTIVRHRTEEYKHAHPDTAGMGGQDS